MTRRLLIRDVTLRDGQQSLFATRMTYSQIEKVLPLYKEAGFYALEVWGGAIPDSIMRYLNEDPWERLEKIKAALGDVSHLTALSRGRNLFGYNPYPEEVIEGFNRNAVKSGISIMRIFDALNDMDNVQSTIKYVKENGGLADGVVCYTVDPRFSRKDRFKAFLKGKKLPKAVFTNEYFINIAKKLETSGADMITLKDMAGLIPPVKAGNIIKALKANVSIPIDFHTHCTPGYGISAALTTILNGVDILDTALLNFSGGPAAPSFEVIQIFCNKLNIETGVNLKVVAEINRQLKDLRIEMAEVDSYKIFPIDFDISNYSLPAHIDKLFDDAIIYAKNNNEIKLQEVCYQIEKYFNFPEPDELVKTAEVPGGMYTNMLAQLKQLKQEHLLPTVLKVIPEVRLAAGCPPLVTPTSQIVGAQAVNCVLDAKNGKPFYSNNSIQFVNLVKGLYGKTPLPIDPEFRLKIAGSRTPIAFDSKSYKKQNNPLLPQYGANIRLANTEKEELLLELFPAVATKFLHDKLDRTLGAKIIRISEEKIRKHEEARAKYNALSKDEKEEILLKGLYSWI